VTRLYDANTRARLELILKGKQLGFTLTEIRRMVQETEDNSASPGLALAPGQVLDQIALLERQRRDLDVAIEELRATHAKMQGADQVAPQEAAVA
jgi:DNA-binding transcriptional MerR regulator